MSFYPEFAQQPFKPHQCIHVNTAGRRCGSYALRNNYNCYHHQSEDMPTVFPNEAFPIDSVQDRDSIQVAIGDVLAQLAANQMDARRASVLLYGLQLASANLPPHARPARQLAAQSAKPATLPAETPDQTPEEEPARIVLRAYTPEEEAYMSYGVSVLGFEPHNHLRPASVTDDDIINHANECRQRHGLSLLKPKRDASGVLISINEYPNKPANHIAPATILPTLQAVAEPPPHQAPPSSQPKSHRAAQKYHLDRKPNFDRIA